MDNRGDIVVNGVCYRDGSWSEIFTTISVHDDNYLDLIKREKLEKQWESLRQEEMKRMGCLWDDPEAL